MGAAPTPSVVVVVAVDAVDWPPWGEEDGAGKWF